MRKLVLVLGMVLAFNLSNAQVFDKWEEVPVVDSFGDPTGESVKRLLVNGTFSNSATSQSKLIVKVTDYGDACLISLYEYGRGPEAKLGLKGAFGSIEYKDANGERGSLRAFASKGGSLYFSKEDYTNFVNALNQSKELRVLVFESSFSDYGTSKYIFTLKPLQ